MAYMKDHRVNTTWIWEEEYPSGQKNFVVRTYQGPQMKLQSVHWDYFTFCCLRPNVFGGIDFCVVIMWSSHSHRYQMLRMLLQKFLWTDSLCLSTNLPSSLHLGRHRHITKCQAAMSMLQPHLRPMSKLLGWESPASKQLHLWYIVLNLSYILYSIVYDALHWASECSKL